MAAYYFCYNCGHSRENHRKVIKVETRENVYLDCLQPIQYHKKGWIEVCQCVEYVSKELIQRENRDEIYTNG